jgi:hypothetical protein
MWRKDGIRGINKGVNAVAIRQMTNWGSRCVLSFPFFTPVSVLPLTLRSGQTAWVSPASSSRLFATRRAFPLARSLTRWTVLRRRLSVVLSDAGTRCVAAPSLPFPSPTDSLLLASVFFCSFKSFRSLAGKQPIEVVRVEMQSMAKGAGGANRPAKPTIANTLAYIYKENGVKGLYRGVTPRIGLGIWQTVRFCFPSFCRSASLSSYRDSG